MSITDINTSFKKNQFLPHLSYATYSIFFILLFELKFSIKSWSICRENIFWISVTTSQFEFMLKCRKKRKGKWDRTGFEITSRKKAIGYIDNWKHFKWRFYITAGIPWRNSNLQRHRSVVQVRQCAYYLIKHNLKYHKDNFQW